MTRHFSILAHLLVIFPILLLVLASTGCTYIGGGQPTQMASPMPRPTIAPSQIPAKVDIPFRSLAQGYRLSSTEPGPGLFLAVDAAGREILASRLDPQDKALLASVDLDQEAILAAFWGLKPSGGFTITMSTVSLEDSAIVVGVLLQEAGADVVKIDAATYPYHVVTMERRSLPATGGLRYRLVSGDALLAEGALP